MTSRSADNGVGLWMTYSHYEGPFSVCYCRFARTVMPASKSGAIYHNSSLLLGVGMIVGYA